MVEEEHWYAQLRARWKPDHVKLLMVAESAPNHGGNISEGRFFYAARLGADNLFRGVVAAMYDVSKDVLKRTGKHPWLQRLRDDGFFLIDLAPYPVNGLSREARKRALLQAVPGCVERAARLEPEGVVVVKVDLYAMLAQPFRAERLPVRFR